jgi:hypothetical protein
MGFFDWIRRTAEQIYEAIETGLRGVIGLHEEIEPYLPTRPATMAQIEEAIEELVDTQRFIREALPDEALRLARGVLDWEPLKNVARVRQWTAMALEDIPASDNYQISVRGVLVGPDGKMTHVDVAFPTGEAYSYDEFLRRAASSLEDDFVANYDMDRSSIVRQFTVALEPYLQTFVPL